MDNKKYLKLWETLYILMICFRKDMGNIYCQSLINFFDSLKFLLPDGRIRYLYIKFMKENPLQLYICNCQKHVKWLVELNNYICSNLNINNINSYTEICKKYDPKKITKNIWGNSVWYFIHYIALNQSKIITRDIGISFKQMMFSLSFLLPCEKCRNHLRTHLQEFPLDDYLITNETLFEWTFILHNIVNKSLKKPIMEYNSARKLYL